MRVGSLGSCPGCSLRDLSPAPFPHSAQARSSSLKPPITRLPRPLPPQAAPAGASGARTVFASAKVPEAVPVRFTLKREVELGQHHVLVGSHPALGNWHLSGSPHMNWGEGHEWHAEIALPPGTAVEFKVWCGRCGGSVLVGGWEPWR